MLIALNFLYAGQKRGLWLQTDELAPEVWAKLSGSIVRRSLGSRSVHFVCAAEWSVQLNRGGHISRAHGSTRYLTGKPLEVLEPTLDGVLQAIALNEQQRVAVPLEGPQRVVRYSNSTEEAKKLIGGRVAAQTVL